MNFIQYSQIFILELEIGGIFISVNSIITGARQGPVASSLVQNITVISASTCDSFQHVDAPAYSTRDPTPSPASGQWARLERHPVLTSWLNFQNRWSVTEVFVALLSNYIFNL